MNFNTFKVAVANKFKQMSQHALFRAATDNDTLWDTYLNSFPPGSDPIYKERTEHDCNCCKQFIRAVGDVVAIENGKLVSIWDINIPDEPEYQAVANGLAQYVKSCKVSNVFLHYENKAGTDKNFQQIVDGVLTWEHFFVNIPKAYVADSGDIPSKLGEIQSTHDVFLRGLSEITMDSIDIVLDLISQNSLYRGEEHSFVVNEFLKLKKKFDAISSNEEKDLFVWVNLSSTAPAVSRLRNTVIGTLLIDISAGVDLETAVKSFESKVAPSNYKRPTALITNKMIENAKATINELGLTSALERRYANINDITINNIVFANRQSRAKLEGDVFDSISSTKKSTSKKFDKVEEVTIENFIQNILPRSESIELLFENKNAGNLVSLIAPSDPTSGRLFKWDNNFSWSYAGELTDSIKERVKKAGGNVTGDVCCRLAWYNYDDLDFHMVEPKDKYEIYFGNRSYTSPSGGRLDVDMNAGRGVTREPVENIFYANKHTMEGGKYTLFVNCFQKRESTNTGFDVELDLDGTLYTFSRQKSLNTGKRIVVAEFEYSKKDGFKLLSSLNSKKQPSKKIWGIETGEFHSVNVMMLSPNYWDEKSVGNKHYFFMLENCVNEESTRGFYNEFMNEELNKHRKVFEVLGSKVKAEFSPNQLSGLGFSSTKKDSVICRVKGSITRIIKIVF